MIVDITVSLTVKQRAARESWLRAKRNYTIVRDAVGIGTPEERFAWHMKVCAHRAYREALRLPATV